ncbi:hypothetical protein [Acidithrix ferrooxidans]|uniref:Uncharacterized protein n=1 Tax=Acidithrix ferrooxidans TaxID=1280514 RepID=A0A0D8HMF0_9ACTN|nr:hypothetical protein [Acidithrix ferrooxidans]KJF18917.1 hypothetical protein AXFE_02040 [Acidithrix ferrooxidans]
METHETMGSSALQVASANGTPIIGAEASNTWGGDPVLEAKRPAITYHNQSDMDLQR